MAIDVYLDVLLIENLIVNWFILWLTSCLFRMKVSQVRLFLGALSGAAYLILLFIPGVEMYHTAIAKILLSVLIIAVAFSPETISMFIKMLLAFYGVSFLMAGAFIGISFLIDGEGFAANSGFISFSPKSMYLCMTIIVLFALFRVIRRYIRERKVHESTLIPLNIHFEDHMVSTNALLDTGNALYDPVSRYPVVVAEYTVLREVLPDDIQQIFETSRENDLGYITAIVSKSCWMSRFRLIPFTSLGKENGLLIGFKPDFVEVMLVQGKKEFREVVVGIYNKRLSRGEQYKALLNPELYV